jgi:hypothetical protein
MVAQSLDVTARKILSKHKIPVNEAQRYIRDWAQAVLDSNDELAWRTWNEYCRYRGQCGFGER